MDNPPVNLESISNRLVREFERDSNKPFLLPSLALEQLRRELKMSAIEEVRGQLLPNFGVGTFSHGVVALFSWALPIGFATQGLPSVAVFISLGLSVALTGLFVFHHLPSERSKRDEKIREIYEIANEVERLALEKLRTLGKIS